MDQVMITAVSSILDGTFKGGVYNLGMDKKVVQVAPFHSLEVKIPQALQDKVAQTVQDVTSGKLQVPVISSPTK